MSDVARAEANPDSGIVLSTRDLRKDFRGYTAVAGVNLDIKAGTIHALIGPNGAGKTTVFNLITRFMPMTAGRIHFEGRDITSVDPANLARNGLVRSFQISAVFGHLTARENVRMALQRALVSPFRFWQGEGRVTHLDEEAESLLARVDLAGVADTRAGDLAYGRKRALELATTLATRPRLMLLDEPTQGLGHEDVERVTDLIKEISVGRTVLMVEHNMRMVSRIADRISVLRRGEIIAEGDYASVSNDPQVVEAYLGTKGRTKH